MPSLEGKWQWRQDAEQGGDESILDTSLDYEESRCRLERVEAQYQKSP